MLVEVEVTIECPKCQHEFTTEVETEVEFQPMINEGYY